MNTGSTGINVGAFYNWLAKVSAIILEPDDKRCLSYSPVLISPKAIPFDVAGVGYSLGLGGWRIRRALAAAGCRLSSRFRLYRAPLTNL
jgi:hypothetical protein